MSVAVTLTVTRAGSASAGLIAFQSASSPAVRNKRGKMPTDVIAGRLGSSGSLRSSSSTRWPLPLVMVAA